jgi:hypothetical protein
MGFISESVEKAILNGKANSIEQALPFVIKSEAGFWEHTHQSWSAIKDKPVEEFCFFCREKDNINHYKLANRHEDVYQTIKARQTQIQQKI